MYMLIYLYSNLSVRIIELISKFCIFNLFLFLLNRKNLFVSQAFQKPGTNTIKSLTIEPQSGATTFYDAFSTITKQVTTPIYKVSLLTYFHLLHTGDR